jgi:hypothetical protein
MARTAPVTAVQDAPGLDEEPTRPMKNKRSPKTTMVVPALQDTSASDEEPTRTAKTRRPSKTTSMPAVHDMEHSEEFTRPLKTRHATASVGSAHGASDPLSRHRSWLKTLLVAFAGVILGAIILITAAMYLRGPSNPHYVSFTGGQTFPIQLGGSSEAFNLWNNSTGPIPSRTPLPKKPGPYSVLGKPTITAAFINQVLSSYNSPTAGMGQSLYDFGVQYGIDPVYALAFFMHESLFGTTGEATVTLSLGNERCIPDRPCIDQDRGGYAKMNSWQDGFEHWYKLIRNLYVAQWGLVTVDQIIPKYAPSSDGNDEAAYIAALKHEVDTWRAGIIRP